MSTTVNGRAAPPETCDVVVVGGGNAAFCAAHAAREAGAEVVVLEKAPRSWAGGNSYFTAGMRTAHAGLADLRSLVNAADAQLSRVEVPPYPVTHFRDDLMRMSSRLASPELVEMLVEESLPTLRWLRRLGLWFELLFDRQSHNINGVRKFWGGTVVGPAGQGKGLIGWHLDRAAATGITICFDTAAKELILAQDRVAGIRYNHAGKEGEIRARSVILAAGGFEASPGRRAHYLGEGWGNIKVRGTPYNTGDMLEAALAVGADRAGDWHSCHATSWDVAAPEHGDRSMTNRFSKDGYPLGIVVNRDGRRFFDTGADFRNYTYVALGKAIAHQPNALAFQIYDAKSIGLLDPAQYEGRAAESMVEAQDIDTLARAAGIDGCLAETIAAFNVAVRGTHFDPAALDEMHTVGIEPPKSHWARPIDTPPFRAYPVTIGITFTFGGLRVDRDFRVLRADKTWLTGLYAAGEMVGGVHVGGYVGGSGLTFGAVSGRWAGTDGARHARKRIS
jgi:tricarballylate dehydrogenase